MSFEETIAVQGQISDYLFAQNGGKTVTFIIFQLFLATSTVLKFRAGIFPDIITQV